MRSKNSEIVLGVTSLTPYSLLFFPYFLRSFLLFLTNIFLLCCFFFSQPPFLCSLQSMVLPFIRRLSLSLYILSIFSSNSLALGNQISFFVFLLFLFFVIFETIHHGRLILDVSFLVISFNLCF
ncbi:hypothetical protein V6Z12_D02G000100 [Gossypium hirsutum]